MNKESGAVDSEIKNWIDRIIENTKDDRPKNPEKCHAFFVLAHRLYPSNN